MKREIVYILMILCFGMMFSSCSKERGLIVNNKTGKDMEVVFFMKTSGMMLSDTRSITIRGEDGANRRNLMVPNEIEWMEGELEEWTDEEIRKFVAPIKFMDFKGANIEVSYDEEEIFELLKENRRNFGKLIEIRITNNMK